MHGVSTQVRASMDVPREWYFSWFPAADLSKIMHRYWMIPGVVGTRDQTGPMHLAGSSRVLQLSDGSTVVEEITSSEPPSVLRYRISQLTNVFRFLVREAQAQFTYQPGLAGGMTVTWRYTYLAHNRAARLLLGPMVAIFWRGYMRGAMRRARQLSQAEWQAQAPGQIE